MNSEIILDLKASIRHPDFNWPECGMSVKIIGYKYTLTIYNPFSTIFSFSIEDVDDQEIEVDYRDVIAIRDWIATNVLPHYLVLN